MSDKNLLNEDEELDDYEPVIIELDGENFELIDMIELDGKNYAALTPYTPEDEMESDELEFIMLEVVDDGDDNKLTLITIDDEELYEKVGDAFIEQFSDDFDEDGE